MKVEGMVCEMGCAKFIKEQVDGLEGVVKSHVNFQAGTAYFEFDKSLISSKEIEEFIDNIHDGQYEATIVPFKDVEEEVTSDEVSSTEENEIEAVSKRIDISFPELFTYFLKRLR